MQLRRQARRHESGSGDVTSAFVTKNDDDDDVEWEQIITCETPIQAT